MMYTLQSGVYTMFKDSKFSLPRYTPVRTLRSASQSLLSRSHTISYKQYGQRSFVYAAAFLRNNLLLQIRNASSVNTFKTML